jgi:hypothetical protein
MRSQALTNVKQIVHTGLWFGLLLWLFQCTSGVQQSLETRECISLNGIWDFYPHGGTQRHDIRVPSFWDAPQDYNYPMEWLHMLHGVYKRSFEIPDSFRGKRIFLQIKRVSVIANVYVNGRQVGGDESRGYLMMQLPYLIDITNEVRFDADNELLVKVWGGQQETYGEGVEAEWKESDFPEDVLDEGMMLYPWCVDHYDGRRGINGDVAIAAYPAIYIENVFVVPDLKKNADASDDVLSVEMTLRNASGAKRQITLHNEVQGEGVVKALPEESVVLQAGETKNIRIENIPWADARYWWPHSPVLYSLQTRLNADGETIDALNSPFGFRQFWVDGNRYRINGRPVNLRAESYEFSWHEGYIHGPSTAPVLSTKELTVNVQERLMKAYQGLNLNTLRVHKASGIDATFDIADTLGMLVIDEVPFWQTQQRTDARAAPYFQTWVRQWIRARRNHPSIVMWSICNECWGSPIAEAAYQAAMETDPTRPAYHQGIRPGDFEGDEQCVHYTGGYPFKAFNTEELYGLYENHPDKPKGEGESMFAEAWPLKNADGTLSDRRAERGQFDHPDLVSQAEWVRGVSRFIRAMRYAGLADSRSYMNWVYCFEVIEDDITPHWHDLTAPEMKPVVLHRPICNMFTDRYPEIIRGDAHKYWADSHALVAVFDVVHDAKNRIGVQPEVFQSGDRMKRTLAVYNDALTGGEEITVKWAVAVYHPHAQSGTDLISGSMEIQVPYGEKRIHNIDFTLPDTDGSGWLHYTLQAWKGNALEFEEKNRLGAMTRIPDPRLTLSVPEADLGKIPAELTQWKKIKLINTGGGLSEKWRVSGYDDVLSLNRVRGNLRGEEEIYYRINPGTVNPGKKVRKVLTFTGASGSEAQFTVQFSLEKP